MSLEECPVPLRAGAGAGVLRLTALPASGVPAPPVNDRPALRGVSASRTPPNWTGERRERATTTAASARPTGGVAPAKKPVDSNTEPPEKSRRRFRSLVRRKEALPARALVEPQGLHFGALRKGDERT